MSRSSRVRGGVTPLLDLMQTLPSFVYLIPTVMIFGPGKIPALIATIVSGEAVYHVGDVAHRVSAGALLLIPAGVEHWIEPVGDRPVENLDVFAPARSDYAHLLDWTRSAAGADPT